VAGEDGTEAKGLSTSLQTHDSNSLDISTTAPEIDSNAKPADTCDNIIAIMGPSTWFRFLKGVGLLDTQVGPHFSPSKALIARYIPIEQYITF